MSYSGTKRKYGVTSLVSLPQYARSMPISAAIKGGVIKKRYQGNVAPYGRFVGKNAELKFFDTDITFTVDATGEVPATGQLNLIPQNATESGRIGRKCVIKSIQARLQWIFTPGASTTGITQCWIYVVLDKQCNGAPAAVTDVLTSNNMSKAMINLDNSARFVILKRMYFKVQAEAGIQTAFAADLGKIDWYKKCNIPLEFDNTAATGALTTIRSNNVFLLAGTDGSSDDTVSVGGTFRLRYSDS